MRGRQKKLWKNIKHDMGCQGYACTMRNISDESDDGETDVRRMPQSGWKMTVWPQKGRKIWEDPRQKQIY